MPIDFKSHPVVQTVVSSRGDIMVEVRGPESHEGMVWVALRESSRRASLGLASQEGVLIGAQDPIDLDDIIDGLISAREQLAIWVKAGGTDPSMETPGAGDLPVKHPSRCPTQPRIFPLQLTSDSAEPLQGSRVRMTITWPVGFGIPSMAGMVASIDGKQWRVISLEAPQPFSSGSQLVLVVTPWSSPNT